VSEAISERVLRLQPKTQQTLEEASVLGQMFGFEDLMTVVDLGEEEIEEALEEAEASGLVRAARELYAFDHALTQHTLYAGLSPVRRKRLHRLAGEGLEKLDEKVRRKRAAEIWHQFVKGFSPERALPYALLAGEEAEAAFAPTEAERHYRRALELAEEVGDEHMAARALEKLGGVLATTVRYDEAISALEQASDAYTTRNDPETVGRIEAQIAQTHFRRGTPKEGIARLSAHVQSLDKPAASEGVRRSLAALYGALARLYAAHMQYAECRDAAERGAILSRTVEGIGSLADAEMMRGLVLLWSDAPDEGVMTLENAILLAERSGALDTLCNVFLPLHIAYRVRGEFDRSREYGERGTTIAEKTGDTDLLAMYTTNLGLQLFYVGDWRKARVYLERAVELARGTQPSYFSCMLFVNLGVLCNAEGAWEDASRCFSEAIARAQDASNPEMLGYARTRQAELDVLRGRPVEAIARLQPWLDASNLTWIYDVVLLRVLAEAYMDTGDAARAEDVAEQAIVRAGLMHNRVDGVEALRVLGKCHSVQGCREGASAALDEALSQACSIPYPYAEGKILREYGMLHIHEGEPERARERLSAAVEIFHRLRAREDAGQTEQVLEATGRIGSR
jgi:tetratricopeptide (TPR) repeat protein